MNVLTDEQMDQLNDIVRETEGMTDREIMVHIYARIRMVDQFIEKARSNPMFAAMM